MWTPYLETDTALEGSGWKEIKSQGEEKTESSGEKNLNSGTNMIPN